MTVRRQILDDVSVSIDNNETSILDMFRNENDEIMPRTDSPIPNIESETIPVENFLTMLDENLNKDQSQCDERANNVVDVDDVTNGTNNNLQQDANNEEIAAVDESNNESTIVESNLLVENVEQPVQTVENDKEINNTIEMIPKQSNQSISITPSAQSTPYKTSDAEGNYKEL